MDNDNIRFLAACLGEELNWERPTLRDQFAMSALAGYMTLEDSRTYKAERDDCVGMTINEWRKKIIADDAAHMYEIATAMMEARK